MTTSASDGATSETDASDYSTQDGYDRGDDGSFRGVLGNVEAAKSAAGVAVEDGLGVKEHGEAAGAVAAECDGPPVVNCADASQAKDKSDGEHDNAFWVASQGGVSLVDYGGKGRTKAQLVRSVAIRCGFSQVDVNRVINVMSRILLDDLEANRPARIAGLTHPLNNDNRGHFFGWCHFVFSRGACFCPGVPHAP